MPEINDRATDTTVDYASFPDVRGRFGDYGGRYVAETLMGPIEELTAAYAKYRNDPGFLEEFETDLRDYVGRPTALYHAKRLSDLYGAEIWLKREDLNHTGAHKINNALGQALLAKRMGKTRIIAETGAGQHGVATATVAARLGIECVVYMGADDIQRQAPNVFRMRLLGATVVPVDSGTRTLKDALNEAMRDWVTNVDDTFYIIGTVAGPHPYPQMVRDFQSVIGREARAQMLEKTGALPDQVVACVGGGSNAIGIFHEFLADESVELHGSEAGGDGVDENGQIIGTHSISAGLDYPGVGPEHAWLKDIGRVHYAAITDDQAMAAFHDTMRCEGIIPAIESAHAVAHARLLAEARGGQRILINMSGRGDKDINTVARLEGIEL